MISRRQFINKTAVLALTMATGFLRLPSALAAWKAEDFAPGLLDATLGRLVQNQNITDSSEITLTIPKIAENGAVVPVSVSTTLPDVQSITLLVEKSGAVGHTISAIARTGSIGIGAAENGGNRRCDRVSGNKRRLLPHQRAGKSHYWRLWGVICPALKSAANR